MRKKALLEHALQTEMTSHLGHDRGSPAAGENVRNGSCPKTVLTEDGPIALEIPRDRAGSFEAAIVPKGVTRLDGFDENIEM